MTYFQVSIRCVICKFNFFLFIVEEHDLNTRWVLRLTYTQLAKGVNGQILANLSNENANVQHLEV